MSKKKIVVIGAGFAGIATTRMLSSKLKNDVEITLIDKHSYQTMMTQLHEVAAGRVPFTYAQYDLQRLLGKRKNISIVTDKVVNVDKDNKKVVTTTGTFAYDYLVVAIGAEPNDFGVPGVKEHGFTLWSLEDALKIKRQLEYILQEASTELDPAKRKAMLTVNVAGSGFSGIEMVGELMDWRKKAARDWKLDEDEITLNVVEMMPTILNALDRKQADKALKYLQKKHVNILLNHAITAVEADKIHVKVGARGEEQTEEVIPSNTLIWTTGVQGNTQAQPYELTETERGHRLLANDYMQAIGYEDSIYVAGDVSGHMDPKTNRPQPQIVEAAEQTGHTAAANIIAAIKGGEKHKFEGKYQGTMVSVGSQWGVAVIGKMRLTGFFAMAMKNFIYVLYTLQIRSLYYMYTYLKDEIFHTKDNRNLMRGHASRRGNVLWAFILRIFFGLAWLLDAVPKIFGNASQSWMGNTLKISTFLKDNGGWLQTPAQLAAAGKKAADAAAGASTAVHAESPDITVQQALSTLAKHGVNITNINPAHGITYEYGTVPAPITNGVPHWMQSIMKIFMPDTVGGYHIALFLQKVMSFVELFLALGIIFGAFTFICSAGTAALTVMFATTGMLTWVSLWYIPVAIALMAGTGRAFGLDRWIQPWLQKFLGRLWYGKPRSIYKGR